MTGVKAIPVRVTKRWAQLRTPALKTAVICSVQGNGRLAADERWSFCFHVYAFCILVTILQHAKAMLEG